MAKRNNSEYSLHVNLASDFRAILESGHGSDFKFICTAPDEEEIDAYKDNHFVFNQATKHGSLLYRSIQNIIPAETEGLRIDMSAEVREIFFSDKVEKVLYRSCREIMKQNYFAKKYFDNGLLFCITAWFIHNDNLKDPEKLNLVFDADPDGMQKQIIERNVGEVCFNTTILTTVRGNRISKIFEPKENFTEENLYNETLVFFEFPKLEKDLLCIHLFDKCKKKFFGYPIITAKPKKDISCHQFSKLLISKNIIGYQCSDIPTWQKLGNWWNSNLASNQQPEVPQVEVPQVKLPDGRMPDGVLFPVHKTILIARCEVFAAMLASSGFQESVTNKCVISDIKPKVFKELLRYLYTDNCDKIGDIAFDLFLAADKYHLSNLKSMAAYAIIQKQCYRNKQILTLAAFGSFFNSYILIRQSVKMILENYHDVINLPEWEVFYRTQPNIMRLIFSELSPQVLNGERDVGE
jgi:hypothetical protein